jgi:thioredoxin-like negative regulator of GroEL
MLGQFREALFPLRMAHFLNETDPHAAFQIAECQLALGEKEQAAASLLLVQSSSAQHSALHTRASELLKELNRAQIPLPRTEQITHQGTTDTGKAPPATAGDRNEGVVTDEEWNCS